MAVFVLTSCFGALVQAVTRRMWVAILIPTVLGSTFMAIKAGLFNSSKPDSTATAVFVGFLPVALAVYVAAAALGAAVVAVLQKKK